jgi:hypothetical protein
MSAALFLGIVAFLSFSLALAARAAQRRRRRAPHTPRGYRHEEVSLPSLTEAEAQQVMREAERAAIEHALGGATRSNPYPRGTRERIIWETHHGATLMDWDEKDQWL